MQHTQTCSDRSRDTVAVLRHISALRDKTVGMRILVVDDDRAIFVTGAIDHRSVLPHCLAAVHHGGAGTTAATLRAGVPALICPVTADQPFWANRVRALGSGDMTRPSTLTDARVDAALASVLAPGVRDAAALMAAQLVAPDKAVAAAADIVEQAVDPRRT